MTDDPPATTPEEGYDELAARADEIDGTGSPWGDNPFQAHYSWPATRKLLPDLADARVLDAGCGVGDHVGWLLDRGAEVVGVDASETALETARDRFGDRAVFHRADLADPLPLDDGVSASDHRERADDSSDERSESDGAFDAVLSHLVLDHLPDWETPLAEFRRVLRPGGTLVFATVHPLKHFTERDLPYYETRAVEVPWPLATFPSYHRPVGTVVNAILDAGFRLDRLAEPEPRPEYAEHAPDRYEAARDRPEVLCVRASVDPS